MTVLNWTPFSSITSSDNIFKFITLSGIVIFLIALFYPTHMQNQLDLDKLKLEQDKLLLNLEVGIIINEVNQLDSLIKKNKSIIIELRKQEGNKDKIDSIKKTINNKYALLKPKEQLILSKTIIQNCERKKIELMQSQIDTYKLYKTLMLIISVQFMGIGGIFWTRSQFLSEKLKKIQCDQL